VSERHPRIDLLDVLLIPVLVFAGYAIAPLDSRLWLGITVSLTAIVLCIPLLARRARAVRVSHTPLVDALRAIAVFGAVLIVAFASMHYSIAFHGNNEYSGISTKLDAVYYTVTTLSTVGYGDITANGQVARLVVTTNILFNLIALGIGLRLVTHAAQQRFQEKGTRLVTPPADEA
jgi:voltage-gated potassium channel